MAFDADVSRGGRALLVGLVGAGPQRGVIQRLRIGCEGLRRRPRGEVYGRVCLLELKSRRRDRIGG